MLYAAVKEETEKSVAAGAVEAPHPHGSLDESSISWDVVIQVPEVHPHAYLQ